MTATIEDVTVDVDLDADIPCDVYPSGHDHPADVRIAFTCGPCDVTTRWNVCRAYYEEMVGAGAILHDGAGHYAGPPEECVIVIRWFR